MASLGTSLSLHILQQEQQHPEFAGQLSMLLNQMAFAAKILSREISRAALVGKLGLVGEKNPTGDSQKKLDVYTNEVIIQAFADTRLVAAVAAEELEDIKCVPGADDADYVLSIDPLDGSSNTDINGALGTIFGIHPRKKGARHDIQEDFRRKGSEQVVAGYVMFSTSTVLVYTIGHGVYGFTLDRDLGEFLLSHEKIKCPRRGKTYSANLANSPVWHPNIEKFVEYVTERDPATHRPYSLRYTGALVADLHRCLLEGGLYFYPADPAHKDGKLRLMYECAPLGFVVEQAGGAASTGTQRILDLEAESIHQRVPFVVGSADDVALYEKFCRDGKA